MFILHTQLFFAKIKGSVHMQVFEYSFTHKTRKKKVTMVVFRTLGKTFHLHSNAFPVFTTI